MIQRLEGHVENMSIIRNIEANLDLCELRIDFDTIKIFYDSNDLIPFIDKDVIYTTRQDVIDGKVERVICEIALLSTIQTVSSSDNVKLIPEGTKRTVCNLDTKTLRMGELYPNVIALMSKYERGSSNKSTWCDCTMIDMNSREFIVRQFSSSGMSIERLEEILSGYVGKYVNFDMKCTQYGNQTSEMFVLPNDVEESPEVIVARTIVQDAINSDSALMEYDKAYDFVNIISKVIDGEPGYALVRMASELYMINAVDNISTDLDIRAMRRAVICSRAYLMPRSTGWSKPFFNSMKAMRIPSLKADKELMLMLDVLCEEQFSSTKQTYIEVRGIVDNIIKIRRGVKDEESVNTFNDIAGKFNGLL